MRITGKRHDYRIDYEAGFDADGRLRGVRLRYASRCGYAADLSGPVNDRTIFHADNAYYLPDVTIESHRLRTNTSSSTAPLPTALLTPTTWRYELRYSRSSGCSRNGNELRTPSWFTGSHRADRISG